MNKEKLLNSLKEMLSENLEVTMVEFYASNPDSNFYVTGSIFKVDEEKRLVYGFASVIKEDGEYVVDSHGDVIEESELLEAAHTFMSDFRSGNVMHEGNKVGEVVESVVFTEDLQKALGIELNKVGWLIAYKVDDTKVWKDVKGGKLSMFSIGGTAIKETM